MHDTATGARHRLSSLCRRHTEAASLIDSSLSPLTPQILFEWLFSFASKDVKCNVAMTAPKEPIATFQACALHLLCTDGISRVKCRHVGADLFVLRCDELRIGECLEDLDKQQKQQERPCALIICWSCAGVI